MESTSSARRGATVVCANNDARTRATLNDEWCAEDVPTVRDGWKDAGLRTSNGFQASEHEASDSCDSFRGRSQGGVMTSAVEQMHKQVRWTDV